MSDVIDRLEESLSAEELVGVATVVSGPAIGEKILVTSDGSTVGGFVGAARAETAVVERARELLAAHETVSFNVEVDGDPTEVFFEAYPPLPKLIVVGAVHVAISLVSVAKTLGFHTIVLDARSVYATRERFPHADELLVEWPATALGSMKLHESSYLVFLTHDEKLDNPGLVVALRSRARYVGALGSKKTHSKRVAALQELGLTGDEIARIHAPVGVDIGGRRPEEIAVSIAAELVAARNGRA